MKEEVSLARWARALRRSALQEMLTRASRPGVISFALGLPAAELFPTAEFAEATGRVLTDPRSLQYSPHFQPLKTHVVELMRRRGVACDEGQVFLTAGAQQGMNLLSRLLLESGRQVITEELIYTGFQQVLAPFQPEVLTVPTDPETGMDVDAVDALLSGGARPAFIYAITDGHNPMAVSMSVAKRERLVELARRHRVPILEDDAYGFLCYEGSPKPPLRALDERWVFYLGSFSKVLAPALRVGWIVAPEELMSPLSVIKEATDIDTTTFTQRVINAYLDAGDLPSHIESLRRHYGLRRDTMLDALRSHFPAEARWRTPESGLFVWVELPEQVNADELFRTALESEGVAFIPGHAFGVDPGRPAPRSMRLNFSHSTPEQIAEGVPRLARALKRLNQGLNSHGD
ncbi:MAG TPA: PLP-dependent aminotransferase family protein [Pyrinomonadaceae bacterium]